ncbi:MAG: MMPL family transporter [Actinomycetota bacterium]
MGTRAGVIKGLTVTGGVITSAGIVLAATFGVLGILPLVFLAELGFAVDLEFYSTRLSCDHFLFHHLFMTSEARSGGHPNFNLKFRELLFDQGRNRWAKVGIVKSKSCLQ